MRLNPEKVIEQCLVTAFNLDDYLHIIEEVHSPGFKATDSFRKKYNGFYTVRQKTAEWYDVYYQLLEEQVEDQRSYEYLLRKLYPVCNTVEVSFVSKMIATVSPEKPIWDQYVLHNLGLKRRWDKLRSAEPDERIKSAAKIYSEMQQWYKAFRISDEGVVCLQKFDEALPSYKHRLTATKKIDYMLWSIR